MCWPWNIGTCHSMSYHIIIYQSLSGDITSYHIRFLSHIISKCIVSNNIILHTSNLIYLTSHSLYQFISSCIYRIALYHFLVPLTHYMSTILWPHGIIVSQILFLVVPHEQHGKNAPQKNNKRQTCQDCERIVSVYTSKNNQKKQTAPAKFRL